MEQIERWLPGAAFREPSGRPFVTLSYAQSLDGCIAARRGEPLAISGHTAQVFTHQLRAAHDAILVGIGTVLSDDPRLNVRLVDGPAPQPVILDGQLRFPLQARLLSGQRLPWIATTAQAPVERRQALEAAGARLLLLPACEGGSVWLPALLEHLAALGIKHLMVEGGARVIRAFLAERLVDFVALTIAPRFLGGLPAVEAVDSTSGTLHNFLPRLETWESMRLGDDLVILGAPVWEAGGSTPDRGPDMP